MAKHFRFNLLVKKERKVFTEAVYFLNSYAKYVIVLTQIIVLFVFFIKIVLDQSVIDLKETVDQKNQIILTAQEMITNNNLLAKKLREVDNILSTNDFRYQSLSTVLSNVPTSITLKSIILESDEIIIDGTSSDPLDIQRLQIRLSKKLKTEAKIIVISKQIDIYLFKLSISHEKNG